VSDYEIESLETVANTLRGMAMDPRIPVDARGILQEKAAEIDAITESHLAAN
jgi:hypothetical protein